MPNRILLAGLIGLMTTLIACDQNKKTSEHTATLMVTWLIPGQPPQTTQTSLLDMASCEAGRKKALAAGKDAQAERVRQNNQDKAEAQADIRQAMAYARAHGGFLSGISPEDQRKLKGEPLPIVSAYCVGD